jgi:ubiquinone/menaquinone biosynthesis C-methylase UbiE
MNSCNNLSAMSQQQYNLIYQKIAKKDVKSYGIVDHGEVPYSVTNRGYDILQRTTYPARYLDDLTPDMRILDVGTGDGHFVEDLQEKGFTGAEGIDIADVMPEDKPYLKQVAFEDTQYPENTFDRIFVSYSIFSYPESSEFQQQALEKIAAILKPGGQLQVAPLPSVSAFKLLVAKVPNLKVSDEGFNQSYLQITKTKPKPVDSERKTSLDVIA